MAGRGVSMSRLIFEGDSGNFHGATVDGGADRHRPELCLRSQHAAESISVESLFFGVLTRIECRRSFERKIGKHGLSDRLMMPERSGNAAVTAV